LRIHHPIPVFQGSVLRKCTVLKLFEKEDKNTAIYGRRNMTYQVIEGN